MRIFKRQLYITEMPSQIFHLMRASANVCRIFKNPLSILSDHIKHTPPKYNAVKLRNGMKIFLSSHIEDVSTVVVVFGKKDYGEVPKDGVIVDIGANIGAFSLYAASRGTKKIYAYEPNSEAYSCFLKNIHENDLQDVIIPFRRAVSGNDDKTAKIPLASNPHSRIQNYTNGETCEGFELVKTISLKTILKENSIDHVDLLKMDCEGMEYDIVRATDNSTFSKIGEIKMEYHAGGTVDELISNLTKYGFKVTKKLTEVCSPSGIVWFSKSC